MGAGGRPSAQFAVDALWGGSGRRRPGLALGVAVHQRAGASRGAALAGCAGVDSGLVQSSRVSAGATGLVKLLSSRRSFGCL